MMAVLEENQDKIPEGEYLRGMNALGSLHNQKQNILQNQPRGGGGGANGWLTLDEVKEDDELYEQVLAVADNIVIELCGEDSSIYLNDNYNLVHRGEEGEIFQLLVNYKPEEGNAGYETSPMILHLALQTIMVRLFDDTYHELEIVRPVSCQCGWRGSQGNWDRHISNPRHQRWVITQRREQFEKSLEDARQRIVARREEGIVYIDELHETPAVKIAREEALAAAEAAGERVVFTTASGVLSWFN